MKIKTCLTHLSFLLILAGLAAFSLSACASGSTEASADARRQILEQRAQQVFASVPAANAEFPGNVMTIDQLVSKLRDPGEASELFLLDTRPRDEWDSQGHIEGAAWVQMQHVADPENLENLPKGKLIICISPTGHTAVQVATILRWLGYRAVILKHGMAAWTQTPAGRLMIEDAQNGINRQYPVTKEGALETIEETPVQQPQEPTAGNEAQKEAARSLLREDVFDKPYPFNHIFANDLYRRLQDPAQKSEIFLLDIRPATAWNSVGHIDGAVHIGWRNLGDPESLALLPRDKLIVVIDEQGQYSGQVTPILRMLGYDAVALRSGMTSWTQTPGSQETIRSIQRADQPVAR